MRKLGLLVLLGVAVAIAIARRSSPDEPTSQVAAGLGGPLAIGSRRALGPGSAAAPARPSVAPQGHVRRLTRDERRRLGEQIAAARQRANPAASSPQAGSADDDAIQVEQVGKPLKDALDGSTHILAECYPQQPGGDAMRDATAMMTMISDPDLGTVIDTDQITDAAGQPIAPKLDECLRDAIDSLALPPLGKGGKLRLQYTFKFD